MTEPSDRPTLPPAPDRGARSAKGADRTLTCARCGRAVDSDDTVCTHCGWSHAAEVAGQPVPMGQKQVMLRDLLIFQLKLFLDGVKDVVLAPLALVAFVWDIIPSRNKNTGRAFYSVLRMGEKYDLWLNLYHATQNAQADTDGFFGESLAGADNLIGKVEQVVRQTVEVGKDTVERALEQRVQAEDRRRGPAGSRGEGTDARPGVDPDRTPKAGPDRDGE